VTYRGHLTRTEIGLAPPRSRSTEITPTGTTLHYAGAAQGVALDLDGHLRCLALWRGYQVFHMQTRGWADIAYTLGACQHGYLLAGRGAGVRTAATGPANGYRYALCSVLGGSETPTRDLLDAVDAGVRMLRTGEVKPAGVAVDSHRDHMSTSCAGDALTAHARTIDGRPINTVRVVDPDLEEDAMTPAQEAKLDRLTEAVDRIPHRVMWDTHEAAKIDTPRADGTLAPAGYRLGRLVEAAAVHSAATRAVLEGDSLTQRLAAALDEIGRPDVDEQALADALLARVLAGGASGA